MWIWSGTNSRAGRTRPDRRPRTPRADVFVGQSILGAQQIPTDLKADDQTHSFIGKPANCPRSRCRGEKWNGTPEGKYSSQSTQPTPGAQGSTRNVEGSGTIVKFGERRHLGKAHSAAALERREGSGIGGVERRGRDVDAVTGRKRADEGRTVTALAREAPCGSAQARRTRRKLSFSTLRLSSSACRPCSSVQRPCFLMNPKGWLACIFRM